jgi:hypothetical protein
MVVEVCDCRQKIDHLVDEDVGLSRRRRLCNLWNAILHKSSKIHFSTFKAETIMASMSVGIIKLNGMRMR